MNIQIDRHSEEPLYLQLAQSIRDMIARGELRPGDRLPTVRALFGETGLSDGTIRHAYELLAREGTLSLIQGKGTFVSDQAGQHSGESRAMAAIDRMLEELTGLGFSTRDIQLYVNVKLSRREDARPLVRVAVVDCNSESLNEAALQLSRLRGVELTEYLLEDVRHAPDQLLGGFPLVITTQTHYHELRALMGEAAQALVQVALSPSPDTLIALARLRPGSRVGVYCRTPRFAQIVQNGLDAVPQLSLGQAPVLLAGSGRPLGDFLPGLEALVVAPDYLAYASPQEQQALDAFSQAGGQLVAYHHQLDQGSRLTVEERVEHLRRP
ncbi:MAG TPA: GntR family transcriptional regulator [Candidatus Excrementavichristensenella intestinipullorum]|nr:GntR family transcriptional regulator [Candidatus Excrementavichristensenella intestinipullorum]